MATPHSSLDRPRKGRSILRIVGIRLLVYVGIALVVAAYAGGLSSIPWPQRQLRSQSTAMSTLHATPEGPGWPHLRGASYDAHSADSDLADSWPAEGPPVLWTREIGRGYSSLIVAGGRVYTQAQSLVDQAVLALDADTGQTIWQYRYGWPYEPGGMYPGPRATPTFAGGRIYFAAPDGLVGCLRADDGRLLWSVDTGRLFQGRGTEFGYACSPLVEAGKVILPVGGANASVVALDAETGVTAWISGDQPASYCGAIPITFEGRRQVVAFLQNELAGFDLSTGRRLWTQSYSHGYDEHSACPLYEEPLLRTMLPFHGGSDLYELQSASPAPDRDKAGCRLKSVRHDPHMSNDVASSVLVDGCVYGFDLRDAQTAPRRPSRGQFRAMDFKTGEILWSSDRPGQATIAVADGKLFLLNDRGEVLILRANPKRYEELARAEVFSGEICWTAPSLDHGRLYLRSPTRAACLYVGKPDQLDRRRRELATPTSALPKVRTVRLGWLLGAEREYPFELPDVHELARWYAFCAGVLAAAAAVGAAAYVALRLAGLGNAGPTTVAVFWISVVTLGMVATPVGNRFSDTFVFTWPVSLFAMHQLALASVLRPKEPYEDRTAAWIGPLASGLFLLGCLVYFDLTRRLSLVPAWYFLPLLPASWPLAIPAARRFSRVHRLWETVLCTFLAFSIHFWATGAVMLWRSSNH